MLLLALAVAGCGGGNNHPGGGGGDLGVAGDLAMPRDMARPPRDMAMLEPCDTVKQDCVDPANKCTTVADPDDPMMQGLKTQCVPLTGMVGRDQSCMRMGPNDPPTANAGHDNCDKGFFCSSNGSLVFDFSQRHCRSFCRSDADCKATPTAKCVGLIPMDTGLCAPTCVLFGDNKDCPMGLECATLIPTYADTTLFITTCRGVGKTAVGMACMSDTDCVSGTSCSNVTGMGNPKCAQFCDDNHPCPMGVMCRRAMGVPLNGGLCG